MKSFLKFYGYLSGYSHKQLYLFILTLSFSPVFIHYSYSQGGPLESGQSRFGGNKHDGLSNWVETIGGGYIMGSSSNSPISRNKTAPNKGGYDFWVIKVNDNGDREWDKTFGGSADDHLMKIINTKDGGFLLGGYTESGISGDKSQPSRGKVDYWIVKISRDGVKQWDKTFGGNDWDYLQDIVETADGSFLLGGYSHSKLSGDRSTSLRGVFDYWVVKVNSTGGKIWNKAFGGAKDATHGGNALTSIVSVPGGFLLVGYSNSLKGYEKSQDPFEDVAPTVAAYDIWIVKINEDGNRIWDKTFGGFMDDIPKSVVVSPSGDYFLCSTSDSGISGNKTVAPKPTSNGYITGHVWLIKIAANGNKISEKFYTKQYYSDYAGITSDSQGYYLMIKGSGEYATTIDKYNWLGQRLWNKRIVINKDYFPAYFSVMRAGNLLVGYEVFYPGDSDPYIYDREIVVYKYESTIYNPHPGNSYFRAINVNSSVPSLLVDNIPFEGSKVAPNFTYTGRVYENQALTLAPPTDDNTARLIRSTVYSTKSSPSTFNLLNIPGGNWEIFLYVWEDNYSTKYSIDIEGIQVVTDYESGEGGSWARLGPFRTVVTDETLNIKAYGGDANISGIFAWNYDSERSKLDVSYEKAPIFAFPNPFTDNILIHLEDTERGKVYLEISDVMGQTVFREQKELVSGSSLIVNSDIKNKGVYFLKIKTATTEKVIRLYKR